MVLPFHTSVVGGFRHMSVPGAASRVNAAMIGDASKNIIKI